MQTFWVVVTLTYILLSAVIIGLSIRTTKVDSSTDPSETEINVNELYEPRVKFIKMAEFKTLQSAKEDEIDEHAKAACLYVFWSSDGQFGEHVTHMLEGLHEAGYDVYVLSNCVLQQPVDPRVVASTKALFERDNVGYDFGAWSEFLFHRSSEWHMGQYDWVLFCNDTFAGPVHGAQSLRHLSLRMRSTGAKLWGLTDNTYHGADWHIQSYYFEAHQDVFTSEAFRSCFPRSVKDKNDLVSKGEIRMSARLRDAGFELGVAFPSLTHYRSENASVWYWDDLIKRGYPLLKHTVEVVDPQKVRYDWRATMKRLCPEFPIEAAAEMFMNQERMHYLKSQSVDMEQAAFGRTFQRVL